MGESLDIDQGVKIAGLVLLAIIAATLLQLVQALYDGVARDTIYMPSMREKRVRSGDDTIM